MGAKMSLKDGFKSVISNITRSTMDFKKSVDSTNKSVKTFTDSTGRLHDETGKFIEQSNKAAVSARTWFGANGKLSSSLSFVTKGALAAAAAFGLMKAKNWLLDSNADMETYKNTLAVVLKDEKKAVDTLAWATDFAAKTPFEIPQIVEATTRLTAYGMNAQKTLGIIGDMAAVMGKDLMSAVEAVADAQTGELERLKEFGITKKMIEDQAKLMKVTVTNNQGQITDQKAFNAVLFKIMEDRYKGGMEMQSKTFKGMLSNVKDFISSAGRTLGQPIFDRFKDGMSSLLGWLNKLQSSGAIQAFANTVGKATDFILKVFGEVKRYVLDVIDKIVKKITQWYNDNKPKIDKLGEALKSAFKKLSEFATPIITWLKDVAIPGLIDVLTTVGGWVLDIANWFSDNWSTMGPIIEGIAIAWGTYLTVTTAIKVATELWTAAQWALNTAMDANPIGLIILGIGALIGLIMLVVQNWDKITAWLSGAVNDVWGFIQDVGNAIGGFFTGIFDSIGFAVSSILNWVQTAFANIGTFFSNLWNGITGAFSSAWDFIRGIGESIGSFFSGVFNGIGSVVNNVVGWITGAWQSFSDFFAGIWQGIMDVVKAPVNFVISAINMLIDGLNMLSFDVPDWIPFVGGKHFGFDIAKIPYLAAGTQNFKGGPAIMNERGGELAILPSGSKVIPSDKTDKILEKPSRGISIQNLVKELHIHQQPGEDPESFATRVIDILYEKLKEAKEIANSGEMGDLIYG